jgi:pyruvate/2-oxoglutarate dehydrogenase complex dihydrolipoamide acyltransferase (E2) component
MKSKKGKEDLIGNYNVKPFPIDRQWTSELFDQLPKKHYMTGLFEVNVTTGLTLIREYETKTGERISTTGWIVKCISESVRKFPQCNVFRYGMNKIVQFDDIDIGLMIERESDEGPKVIQYVIRKCQEKDLLTISREIRAAAQKKIISKEKKTLKKPLKARLFDGIVLHIVPKWIRQHLIAHQLADPFWVKKMTGLAFVSSVGMFTNTPVWPISFGGIATIWFAIGSITKRLVKVGTDIVEQDFMQITGALDHTLFDGGPAARYQAYFVQLVESGFGLHDLISVVKK